jgi:hypothetical protein
MRTPAQARELANAFLASSEFASAKPVLLDSKTEEFPEGWVFWYQSARFLETRDVGDSLVGNAPIFVSRVEQSPVHISYHRPTSESIEAFRSCGNANAKPSPAVKLSGLRPGVEVVSAIQLIREHSGLSLGLAKRLVEDCLAGHVVHVETKDVASARALAAALGQQGILAATAYDA